MDPEDFEDLDKPFSRPAKIFLWVYGGSTLVALIVGIVDAITHR